MIKIPSNSPHQRTPLDESLAEIRGIKKAAQDFESLLLTELFKSMRKTVPKHSGGGLGRDVYEGMLDEELAKEVSGTGTVGIAEILEQDFMGYLGDESALYATLMDGDWTRPVSTTIGELSSGQQFGAPRAGKRPEDCERGHCGVDIAQVTGTPVVAPTVGVVTAIGRERDSNAGLWVELEHRGGKVKTRYLHLDSIKDGLKEGDILRKGVSLGEIGNTGKASQGAHLHFEIFQTNAQGERNYVNPEPFLRTWSVQTPSNAPDGPSVGDFSPKVSRESADVRYDDLYNHSGHSGHEHGNPLSAKARQGMRRYGLGETSGGRR